MRNFKGQALVESLFFIPLLAMIIVAIGWFSRVVITRQQLLSAARYGTDLIVYTPLSEEDIRKEIRNYLTHRWNKGRTLDANRMDEADIRIVINDFPPVSLLAKDVLVKPFRLKKILAEFYNPARSASSVEIAYRFAVPQLFAPVAGRELTVTARSEVLSGTGCRKGIHKRNF